MINKSNDLLRYHNLSILILFTDFMILIYKVAKSQSINCHLTQLFPINSTSSTKLILYLNQNNTILNSHPKSIVYVKQ